MSFLIVAATQKEINPLIEMLNSENLLNNIDPNSELSDGSFIKGKPFSILVSGIGQIATTYNLTKCLCSTSYKAVINLGIAGSLSDDIKIGTLVRVRDEVLADFGAEDVNELMDAFDMGLLKPNQVPFSNGKLSVKNLPFSVRSIEELPIVSSATVNRVLGNERSIKFVREKYGVKIVNMEGAAVHYVCTSYGIPCTQIRAISDVVTAQRDKSSWDINGAIKAINNFAVTLVHELHQI